MPAAMELVFRTDTSRIISKFESLKKQGVRVWVNSLWADLNAGHEDDLAVTNVQDSYGWIVDKGANMIQADRPELLLGYLRSRGLHN